MPFTLQEVEKALLPSAQLRLPPAERTYSLDNDQQLTADYLMGNITSLQGLQPNPKIDIHGLINLLGQLDPPSPNDQLVMDIIVHPAVSRSMYIYLLDYLSLNCIQLGTPSSFQSAVNILQQNGRRPELLVYGVLHKLNIASYEDWQALSPVSPIKQFLVANIPSDVSLLVHPFSHGYMSVPIDPVTFYLLEEFRPQLLPDYIEKCFNLTYAHQTVAFLQKHKNGAYLPILETMVTRTGNARDTDRQVEVAAGLFFTDKIKYKSSVLQAVESYLAHWKQAVFIQQHYEHTLNINEFRKLGLRNIRNSTACWFFLLQYDPAQAFAQAAQWHAEKLPLHGDTLAIFYQFTGRDALNLLLSAVSLDTGDIEPRKQAIALLTQHFDWADYGPTLRALMSHKSKSMRELVARTLVEQDPGAEAITIPLLQHKKSEIRQSAATILNLIATPTAKAAMAEALDKETNDNARDILLETLADSLPEHGDRSYVDTLIAAAAARGKLNKPSPLIPDEAALPELFYTTGERLDIPAIRFLLYRTSRCKSFNSDIEARYLIRLIDKTSSGPFATFLLKVFLDRQATSEEKYLVLLAALLGNEDTAFAIRQLIDSWINNARPKMAEYGIGALAIQGSDKALRWVEWYSRKYAVKKANVGAAATAALEAAATELGITTYELGDRVVPDFGFDGLFRHFEVDGESYRAFIDSKFKLAFFNENDKKLKAIPSNASAELKQEFKDITKEVKDIVKSQSPRLEYYLIIQRRWSLAQWQKFFLNNPVMFIYATRLLWGVYKDQAETPDLTFLCDEDTTLLDLQDEEPTTSPEWNVGIVHPSQLDPSTLRAWQEKFFDRSIEAVFPQLDRQQADLEGLDLSRTILRKFEGRRTQTGSIRSTLDRRGWRPGPTGDGGMIGTYHLRHDAKKIEAVLEIEGVGAGFGWTGDERLGRLFFIRKEDHRKKWWHYPKDETDPLLVPPNEIPTLFLHEALAAIDAIKPA